MASPRPIWRQSPLIVRSAALRKCAEPAPCSVCLFMITRSTQTHFGHIRGLMPDVDGCIDRFAISSDGGYAMVDPSEPPRDLPNRATTVSRPSRRSDPTESHGARIDDRGVDFEWIKPTAPRQRSHATEGPNDRTSSGDNAAPTGEDFRRNRAELSTDLADIDHRDVAQDPRSTSESREPPEPPWKRSKQRRPFAGDIAAVELRNRLCPPPDRLPPPPSPGSISSTFASAGRLIAVTMVAA